ncbi:MAG: tetratricopeptide repeat protein [Spirochaetia bacterium]|jgi:tetratricopeptide (TPR) repeat protein|nr:tetratricopeptide repeat protein [Spirochaetia bacterium]
MQNNYIFLLPILLGLIVIIILFVITSKKHKNESGKKTKHTKNKSNTALQKDANKKLAQNPKDAEALLILAGIYFDEAKFDKALRNYEMLIDLCATQKTIDEFNVTLKFALSAMELKRFNEAFKALMICRGMKQDIFEVDYNLGFLLFKQKSYEKAAGLLLKARKLKPDHNLCARYLGHSLFHLKRMKEAALLLRKTIDIEPDDKESLFILAQAYNTLGQQEQALRIFSHLRPDPIMGPNAALFAGLINLKLHQTDKAIMDFEIGLRHEAISKNIKTDIQYNLAITYLEKQDLGKALGLMKELQARIPGYKDIPVLIAKYDELNKNRNLQVYLISPTSEFVTLCRKLTTVFYPQAKVKITDISVQKNQHADILAEVSTKKWDDIILFRFIRSTGQVGEFTLRDLYSKTKEVKAGKGYCITAGTYSDGAHKFVEARLIDLIEKAKLTEYLEKVE